MRNLSKAKQKKNSKIPSIFHGCGSQAECQGTLESCMNLEGHYMLFEFSRESQQQPLDTDTVQSAILLFELKY